MGDIFALKNLALFVILVTVVLANLVLADMVSLMECAKNAEAAETEPAAEAWIIVSLAVVPVLLR